MSQPDGVAGVPADPSEGDPGRPVIRDRRKVDPATGAVRTPVAPGTEATGGAEVAGTEGTGTEGAGGADPGQASPGQGSDPLVQALADLAERTADLQRLQAEYVNYRRRVERDRDLAGEIGRGEVLAALIPVLDDIDAARGAGDLDGPFGAICDKLSAALSGRFALVRYGEVGEAFDPAVHEALTHSTDPSVSGPTVDLVIQPGYRMGERMLRPARVGVADTE